MDVEGTQSRTLHTAHSPILRQISPIQTLPFHFFKIYLNIVFPPMPKFFKWLFSVRFPTKGPDTFLFSPIKCHMLRPSHPSSFDHPNIWRRGNHEAPHHETVSGLPLRLPHTPEYLSWLSSLQHSQPVSVLAVIAPTLSANVLRLLWHQVSHPHKTSKIIIQHILLFTFLDSKTKYKSEWTERYHAFLWFNSI